MRVREVMLLTPRTALACKDIIHGTNEPERCDKGIDKSIAKDAEHELCGSVRDMAANEQKGDRENTHNKAREYKERNGYIEPLEREARHETVGERDAGREIVGPEEIEYKRCNGDKE
jgi:hypothetical protein